MQHKAALGVGSIMGANIAFSAMVCLVRFASDIDPYTTTLFRFVVGMGVVGLLALSGRAKLSFVNKPGLFWRGMLGGIAICIGFISIIKLGIIKSSIIVNTYPMFAILFSVLLLGERLSVVRIGAMIASFCGVMLIFMQRGGSTVSLFAGVGGWELLALGGAMLGGLTVTLVKGLQKTDTTLTIFFAQCLIGFWLVLLPAGAAGHSAGMGQSLLLVAIGLASTTGQLLLTEGYRYVTVSTGSVLTMLGPVLTLAAGAFLFHEHFSSLMVLGAALVLGSCVMMTVLSGSEPPAVVRVPGVGQMGGGG